MSKVLKILVHIELCIALIAIGYFIRKPETDTVYKYEYVEGPKITDTITIHKPVSIVTPVDTVDLITYCLKNNLYKDLFPTDKVYVYQEDTLKNRIAEDWRKTRKYSQTLFNSDTLGKLQINIDVEHNQLSTVSYNFQPQIKTVITERKFRPFIGIGITNQPTLFGQAGLMYKNYGIGAIYQYPSTVGASFIYVF